MKNLAPILITIGAIFMAGCLNKPREEASSDNSTVQAPTDNVPPPAQSVRGKVVMELYPAKAPKTCEQILSLIDAGFYTGQRFHRVENWVVQWGDPQSKQDNWKQLQVGTQGSGRQLPFEPNDIKMQPGTVAMASTGEKVGGDSQIFILTSQAGPNGPQLQGKYAAFGKVLEGMDVVDKIQQGDKLTMKRSGPQSADKKAPVRVEMEVSSG